MKTKQLIEMNLPILGLNNKVTGTYSQRFTSMHYANMKIMELEAEGVRFQDPHNIKHYSLVEVPDESNLQ